MTEPVQKELKLEDIPPKTHFWVVTATERKLAFKDCSNTARWDHPAFPINIKALKGAHLELYKKEEIK